MGGGGGGKQGRSLIWVHRPRDAKNFEGAKLNLCVCEARRARPRCALSPCGPTGEQLL